MPAVKTTETQAIQHGIPDADNPLVVAPDLAAHALDGFHPPVAEWFRAAFPSPTRPQALGWPIIQSGASTLILSPTGSGKTLTAFLSAIDRLMFEPKPTNIGGVRPLDAPRRSQVSARGQSLLALLILRAGNGR